MSQAMSFPSQVPTLPLPPESILVAALNEYKKNTGNDLLSHPLSAELQRCDSVDGILAILQRQANTVEKFRDSNRGMMKWISSSVNILYSISATLGDGVGLVRPSGNELMATEAHSDVMSGVPTCETRSLLALEFSSLSVPCRPIFVHILKL